MLLTKKWTDRFFNVKHVSDRLMMINEVVITALPIYALLSGYTNADKESFYDSLQNLTVIIDNSEMLLICGDFKRHTGKESLGYEGINGGYGFGNCNVDGERILEFAVANNLVVGNLKFPKKDDHLIKY